MAASSRSSEDKRPKRPPATTLEAREKQMVALAVDLAEKQIIAGTASSQVITHYLKLGTTREKLEQEKLIKENELLATRADSIASSKRMEELYEAALDSMREYSGQKVPDDVTD